MDVSSDRQAFSSVLTSWLSRGCDWREARHRFHDCFARGSTYDQDRLVAAANLFDLLPSTVFPSKPSFPDEILEAVQGFREVVQQLKQSHGEQRELLDGLLNGLGRICRHTLKQKVRGRATCILERLGNLFPELERVIDKAVDGRNRYVHGTPTRIMTVANEANLLVFFTRTLEFVFGVSDLIDSGWDATGWLSRRLYGEHPFGEFVADYGRIVPLFLKALGDTSAEST